MSTITWNTTIAPTGGDWDTAANWVGGVIPTATDSAVINLTSAGMVTLNNGNTDSVAGLKTNGSTTLHVGSGSLTLGIDASSFSGPVTVEPGATMAFSAGGSVTINSGVTLTDNGTVSFGTGDVVTFSPYGSGGAITVGNGGLLSAVNTQFVSNDLRYTTSINVNAGGRLTASGSTFALNNLNFDNASLMGAGDLTGNTFNQAIAVPYNDVQYLAGNASFHAININAGSINSGTLALNLIGSPANLSYVFPSSFTVQPGATMTVAANVPVTINSGVTLTDNGTVSFGTGDVVTFSPYGSGGAITVGNGGLLSAVNTQFVSNDLRYTTSINVNAGGRLTASGSTFALNNLNFDNASLMGAGDLTGNTFNQAIAVPYNDVQYLAGNASFHAININAGSINSGTLALNLIGSPANLSYVFPSSFTVQPGATMTVAANVPVTINSGVTLTDNGTVSFGTGDVVTFSPYGSGGAITVGNGGLLSAVNTQFVSNDLRYTTSINVNAGGRLTASGSTFALNNLNFDNASLMGAGDLTGNTFNQAIAVPYNDVQYLAGNASFHAININAGSINSGTLALNLIGSPANLSYVFPSSFTVQPGATMTVAANVPVTINSGVTLTDNGTVSFGTGDVVTFSPYGSGGAITVGNGGLLSAVNTQFVSNDLRYTTSINVNAGGRLTASGSTFALNNLNFDNASLMGAGDLTGNTFNQAIAVPYNDVQYLAGNASFHAININAGSINSGTLALNLIGSPANLSYVFPSSFTVQPGATMTVAANVPVTINSGVTLTDNGTVSFGTGDVVTFSPYGSGGAITVGNGGLLSAVNTQFVSNDLRYTTSINVNAGGRLTASGSTFALNNLNFNSGSSGTLGNDSFSTVLTLNSAATLNIHGNDFSNIGSLGVVAVGDPNANIDLTSNYWGTTNSSQIQAKILDHNANPTTRPTILFSSSLSSSLATFTGFVFNDLNGNGVQNTGEPGLGGATVYIDVNNTGSLVSTDPVTVTDASGQYSFYGLAAGTYIVRELPPSGAVQTAPSTAAVTTTVDFDGAGSEAGITGAGVSNFTYHGASFSGGTIFAPGLGQSALLASGTLAYNASTQPAQVVFSQPIVAATFFYVHGFGYGGSTDVATAYAADGSVVATVSSIAATSTDDMANFVGLTGSKPITRITFVGGVVDNFTFSTVNNTANSVVLAAGQVVSNVNFGDQRVPVALEANSITPTPTGFVVTFAAPIDPSVLNLYDASNALGQADVTLVGASGGPVSGSLIVGADHKTVTFLKTGGILAPDTYTITLRSGADAFKSATGAPLDGNNDGTPGDNLTSTFTVSPPPAGAVVVSVGDAVRGPGQAVQVPNGGAGLPIAISSGTNVFGLLLTLTYDPTLLTVTDVTLAAGLPADWEIAVNTDTPGEVRVDIDGLTALGDGPVTLMNLVATVPTGAPYASKDLLHFTQVEVIDGSTNSIPSIGDDGLHLVAYPGDLSGNGGINPGDVTLLRRVIVGQDSGFAAYQMVDPQIVGDVNSSQTLNPGDVTQVRRFLLNQSQTAIPAIPGGVSFTSSGLDPEIFIPTDLTGNPGDVVTVPVRMLVTESGGIGMSGYLVVIQYDTSRFHFESVQLGGLLANDPNHFDIYVNNVDDAGTIVVEGNTVSNDDKAFAYNTLGDLLLLSFTILSDAPNGVSQINLRQSLGNSVTGLTDLNGDLTLSPAPTNASNDSVDGTLTIGPIKASTTTTAGDVGTTFNSAAQDVSLSATVTTAAGTVDDGSVTFTILNGDTVVGSSTVADVSAGSATATYSLPANLAPGTYTIKAVYGGSAGLLTATDATHHLVITAAASDSTASSSAATYGDTQVTLKTTITSNAGVINEGNVTFKILDGTNVIGTATAVAVANGSASVVYALPAGLMGGIYIIDIYYGGTVNFAPYHDSSQTLVINPAVSATAAATASATYGDTHVTLTASVTGPGGININEGNETFTIFSGDGTTVIGNATAVAVADGTATVNYVLPAGLIGGTYIIDAHYDGTVNYAPFDDSSRTLIINPAVSATAAASATAIYGDVNVTLTASVTGPGGIHINEGNETFTIYGPGHVTIGTATAVAVADGTATVSYLLPAGLMGGTYIIDAHYDGTVNYAPFDDSSRTIIINPAVSATAAASATATYGDTHVTLTATVTGPGGIHINEGNETFEILEGGIGGTVIGTATAIAVANGTATVVYALPPGLAGGTYIIHAHYDGTANYAPYDDSSETLVVGAAASATAAANASATYGDTHVTLTASVTGPGGININEGNETFTIFNGDGTTVIGTATAVAVADGTATVSYLLPTGLIGGTYIIDAHYDGTTNYAPFDDSSHTLVVGAAASATAAAGATATYGDVNVTLNATVTGPGGININEGNETFTIFGPGHAAIGTATAVAVADGSAGVVYALPAGLAAGTYTIDAHYDGTTNFAPIDDSSRTLVIGAAASASAAADATATFGDTKVTLTATVTGPDGVIVNEGTEMFVLIGPNGLGIVVGSGVTKAVADGSVSVDYDLPAGLEAGTYIIQTHYSGSDNLKPNDDAGHQLIIAAAASATATAGASATYGDPNVTLKATITSGAGVVDEGNVTFKILDGTNVIGTATAVAVANGSATVVYALPAGLGAGTYAVAVHFDGTGNFGGSDAATQPLNVGAAASATAAVTASVPFSEAAQVVPLSAKVTGPGGLVGGGSVTFTLLNAGVAVGSSVTVGVVAGVANASYTLPAGTPAGTYTIQADFGGTPNLGVSADGGHLLTVGATATATASADATAPFSASAQTIPLSATVSSAAGVVDVGSVTFTLLDHGSPIGSPLTVPVSGGKAAGDFTLPGGTPAGSYTIQAAYGGTPDLAGSGDSGHALDVAPATTAIGASGASVPFNSGSQAVPLSATVSSPSGTVGEGSVTFTLLDHGNPVGSPLTVPVTNGAAAGDFTLPGGTPAGQYTIQADYDGTPNLTGSTDATHALDVTPATTTTGAPDASVPFRSGSQMVPLISATVSSPSGTVGDGSMTFTLLDHGNPVGSPLTVPVADGAAAGDYTLPAGTPAGRYTIQAAYGGTPNLAPSSDAGHTLTVTVPSVTVDTVAVHWGSQTAALQTATDGVRLLPDGRSVDLPWFNIDRIVITLSQAASFDPGDISVRGVKGGDYGPVTVSGSGTTDVTITLGKSIGAADVVTLTIGNDEVISYKRRIDVLPGDRTDEGVVNTTDGVHVLTETTPAHAYNVFDDFNGDGAVTTADFTLYRPSIGTVLPTPPPQLVAGGQGPGGATPLPQDVLAPVLAAAIDAWSSAGISPQDAARLRGVSLQVADLPAGYLGTTAIGGQAVYISADAGGYGWFVDPSVAGAASTDGLPASPAGHEDLLTVVEHELGHVLGLDDLDPTAYPTDLMAETLSTGVRRGPSALDVAAVAASWPGVPTAPAVAVFLPPAVALPAPTPAPTPTTAPTSGGLSFKAPYRSRFHRPGA